MFLDFRYSRFRGKDRVGLFFGCKYVFFPLICISVLLFNVCVYANVPIQLGLEVVATGLNSPVYVTGAPGDADRLFIVLQGGQIRVYENDGMRGTPLLDIAGIVTSGGERGLLGLAFHPQYQSNGYFYVNYTRETGGQLRTYISRFTVPDPATASTVSTASELALLIFDQPFNNHNGGALAFSPLDGYLYIATGDGGSANDPFNNAQNLGNLLGKMLRIDVDLKGDGGGANYDIPSDNPFYASLSARDEIWAYGLRNPYRFSFDRLTGDMWIGDVGQNDWEEVDYQAYWSTGGENYGWRVFEAAQCNTPTVQQSECNALVGQVVNPVHAYPNSEDGRAIVGGYVYRGSALPGMDGAYFFADYSFGRVWSFEGSQAENLIEWTNVIDPGGTLLPGLSSFGEGPGGELYVTNLGGVVYKLVDLSPNEGEGAGEAPHSADVNGDFTISLSELLRVIQFFNLFALHCSPGTEDGYAPLAGDESCASHASDYNPQDWSISLSELLRMVQFFNANCFVECVQGEDGYCPLFL